MQNNCYLTNSKVFLFVLHFLFLNNLTYSQPGTLDLSYGREGIVTTGIISEITPGIVIQPDGKIVVGGYNTVNGDIIYSEYGLSRYFPNGAVDTAFGYRGIVHTTFPGTFAKEWIWFYNRMVKLFWLVKIIVNTLWPGIIQMERWMQLLV
ncbi:MAG: hypothetical protein IPP71_08040 [Bacteroidetes bacterium]|nr:hypothetical protein [Bacteroidota bacterium]